METVTAQDAAASVPTLVENAIKGVSTTITRYGKPKAVLVPVEGIHLGGLPAQMLVSMSLWLMQDYVPAGSLSSSIPGVERLGNAILLEGESRGWPEGWWEDPSVIKELQQGESTR